MPDPPDPHFPDVLLAVAAKLGWRVVVRGANGIELGELVHGSSARPLILSRGDSSGTVRWLIVDALPPRTAAWLISRETFDMLTHATSNADGSLTYKDRACRLIVDFDGSHNIATDVPA